MSYTVNDVYNDMTDNMTGRVMVAQTCYNWIKKTVLELSQTYKFPGLQVLGPQYQLTPYMAGPYAYQNFMPTGNPPGSNEPYSSLDITNIDSLFVYYEQPVILSASNGENPGIQMKFKTYDSIALSLNIAGQPIYWTRYQGSIWIAFAPIMNYTVYAAVRFSHPFSTPVASTDPILLGDEWQDIVGYCACERASIAFNLMDRANDFHSKVYGDPKWQASGGTEGAPGLIFMRTSQEQRDKQLSNIQMRLRMPSPMAR